MCNDGAWVENKGVLLTYHYREVSSEKRQVLVPRAQEIISECGFKVKLRDVDVITFVYSTT